MKSPKVRDLIYFDFEKASSIWSQLQWGRLERISVTSEDVTSSENKAQIGIPKIASAEFSAGDSDKRTILHTKFLHHDLLNRVESTLSSEGLVANLDRLLPKDVDSPIDIRNAIGEMPYIMASGWSVIEDYKRMIFILDRFNALVDFISMTAIDKVKESPEYQEFESLLNQQKSEIKNIKDRNKKAIAKQKVKATEDTINRMLQSEVSGLDEEFVNGLTLWLNTFVADRINFRIFPFEDCPSFQVICNLKRDSFVDQDLDHLLYGYGIRPNVQLSIFGLITSFPSEEGIPFDPMAEYDQIENPDDEGGFEKAARQMFVALEGLEDLVSFSRYPNITVHPIAVFRTFKQFEDIETS